MRNNSLSFRLALVAGLGSAAALLLTGLMFTTLFRQAVERNFDDRLYSLLSALVGATVVGEEVQPTLVDSLGEPRFNLPQSGWYWQIRDGGGGEIIATSESLYGDALPVLELPSGEESPRILTLRGPRGETLRAIEQLISLADGGRFAVLVAGETASIAQDVANFRRTVALTLGAFALLLAVGMALLIRFGLRPLRDVRRALHRVRHGEQANLTGAFPREIQPLVDDLNALLTSNREIVERARTHVGNLAHALKTPLAVLQNEAAEADHPLAARVGDQVSIMRDQVGRHLDRARMAAQLNVIGAITPVAPILESLARVMRKIHQDRDVAIEVRAPPELRFRGERHDLEEMAGNLFDNACKWARSRVSVAVRPWSEGRRDMLAILVEDDGPGLEEARKQAALARGARMDESKPGSGLGLSIVVELARIYGGTLRLETSRLGGLAAILVLPLVADEEL